MSLSKAIRQLRLAVRSLEEIGWHGGKALHASASHSHRKMTRFRLGVGFLVAPIVFSEQLAATADILETAKNNIPQNALSVNSAFGEGRGFERSKTKGKMYAAKKVAETCATAFQDLSGNRPTVTTDVNYNNPRGLFYNFVREIFRLLELKASPET